MKNINLKLYTFDELDKDIQKQVIENSRDIIGNDNLDFWFDDYIYEKRSELHKKGFTDAELHYGISLSQSDYVHLITGAIDLEALKKAGIYDYTETIKKHTVHMKAFKAIVLDYTRFYVSDYEVDDISHKEKAYNILDLIAFDISEDLEKIISEIEYSARQDLENIFCDAYDDKSIADILTENDSLYFADGTEYNDAMKIA